MNGHIQLSAVASGLRRGVLGATNDRVMLTLQGCSLPKCPRCTSPHTWEANGGHLVPLANLKRWMHSLPRVNGLTITGGEPTDQAEALTSLLGWFRSEFPGAEVVLYSALLWHRLQQRHPELIDLCDVVVAGPFVAGLAPTPLAGSSNQTLHLQTPRAERLYAGWETWPMHCAQISQTGKLIVGIPSRTMSQSNNPATNL